jgi:hypothetical protein
VSSKYNVFPFITDSFKRPMISRFICPVCHAIVSDIDFIFSDRFVEGLEPVCHEVINLCQECIG